MKKFGKTVVFSCFADRNFFDSVYCYYTKYLIVRGVSLTEMQEMVPACNWVLQLTDLHNYQYGRDNQRLIAKIQKQKPDVIFMTGDMLNEDEDRTDILLHLVREACAIAPVLFFTGQS